MNDGCKLENIFHYNDVSGQYFPVKLEFRKIVPLPKFSSNVELYVLFG